MNERLDLLYAMGFVGPLMLVAVLVRQVRALRSKISPEHRAPRAELPVAKVVRSR